MVDKFFASCSTLASWLTSNVHQLKLDKDPMDRVWLTSALSALSISAEYLCHLLIARSLCKIILLKLFRYIFCLSLSWYFNSGE